MSGSACSGLIATHLGWRAAFLSAAGVAALAALLVALVLKPRRNVTRQTLSIAGALANYRIVFANPRTSAPAQALEPTGIVLMMGAGSALLAQWGIIRLLDLSPSQLMRWMAPLIAIAATLITGSLLFLALGLWMLAGLQGWL